MIKTVSLILTGALFVAGCTILAAADAANAPASPSPMTPEQVIALLNSWKEVIFVALGILATVVTWIISRVQSIKEQVCRHGDRIDTQQAQITGIAMQTPTLAPAVPPTSPVSPLTSSVPPPAIKLLVILAAVLAIPGCSTTTPDAVKNIRNAGLNAAGSAALQDAVTVIGQAAVNSLLAAAQTDMAGGNVSARSLEQSAAQGLWTQVTPAAFTTNFGSIVDAYSAGKAQQTAREAAKIVPGGNPVQTASAIAAVISTAAGAPPAP